MRRLLAIGAASAVLLGLLPPSAAQASQSGPGWSARWQYTSSTQLTMRMTRPGAVLSGNASDNAGNRTGLITVQDTSSTDGRCAVARIQEVDDLFTTVNTRIIEACNRSVIVSLASPHELDIDLCDHVPVGVDGTCAGMIIENTGPDPSLRSTGTGVGWGYLTIPGFTNRFTFSLQRPGVRISGSGERRRDGTWIASASLDTTTNPALFCASGQFNRSDGGDLQIQTCQRATTGFGSLTTSVQFTARACQQILTTRRCLFGTIA
jgi:hypothetical protein